MRYIDISITTSRCVSAFEQSHSNFMSLLQVSKVKFSYIIFYILDIKFRTWCESIQTLSDLIRLMFIVHSRAGRICRQFKQIITKFLHYYKSEYEQLLEELLSNKNINDEDKKIIRYFIDVHENLFNKFKDLILHLQPPKENGEFLDYIRNYTKILIQAMELTVLEITSINRILIDNKVYYSMVAVNWYHQYNFDYITKIKETTNLPVVDTIPIEPVAEKFKLVFSNIIDGAA